MNATCHTVAQQALLNLVKTDPTPKESLTCSPAWNARIATAALDMARLEALGAKRLEALYTTTCRWRLWRGVNNIVTLDGGVPVHSNDVIRRPTRRTATAAANKLHGHTQCLGA